MCDENTLNETSGTALTEVVSLCLGQMFRLKSFSTPS